ncbi:hypothetical protein BSL78_09017 [Apostichopus japonicus]|uniref:Kinesin-like protein 6 n=1 Tax=Stichopus japonicus TaxID=307972 RepID=A0A2G8L1E7_STIJA|nr:hypothetical protein BSL78_09017 [Apostichopus japonicus]
MSKKSTELLDPGNLNSEPKRFAFDYSYWSHDGFKVRNDGYCEPADKNYVDQEKIFSDLGQVLLDNAWLGYNCCLFAYGQTGSGKSYSVFGYGQNKGIVPVACERLFDRISEKRANADKSREEEYQVFVSMLEIYNEQIRDLLNPNSFKLKGGLKVRLHASKGFYVESLKTFPVKSYNDINSRINEGTRNRTIASTNMNATSSRAHTIVTINFVQKGKNDAGQNMTKTSIINLVDLAGSERVDSTGATGDRLKEGAAINLSLTSLGNVIKSLADVGAGKKGVMIPYRDSKLTMLLKNALGGNSKTIMIAAISPADINYDETLSTLRYEPKASRRRLSLMKVHREAYKRTERRECSSMKQLEGKGGLGETQGEVTMQGVPEEGEDEDEVEEMKKELEEQLRQNEEEMNAMKKSWEQRLKEVQTAQEEELEKERKKREDMKVTPHFWNLNEDPALTGMIIHFVKPGVTKIGSNKAASVPDILLNGLNIQPEHGVVSNRNNVVSIKPCLPAKILVNGKALTEKMELHHNDRVMYGSKHLYVFHHPQDLAKNPDKEKKEESPTYNSAQEEIVANSGFDMTKGSDKSQDDLLLQQELVELMPHVNEANAMSDELKKRIRFEIVLISPQSQGLSHGRTQVSVVMKNLSNENEFVWDRNKFLNRKYLMEEMYQDFVNGDKDWDVDQNKDPFWEPPETEVLVGVVHIFLQSLSYLIEIEEFLGIVDYRGGQQGLLKVDIVPCTQNGDLLPEEDFVDDPKELLNRAVNFKISIAHARGLPSRIKKSFCKYQTYLDKKPRKTKAIEGTRNPDYKYEAIVSSKIVTEKLLSYLENETLVIYVWGTQNDVAVENAGGAGLVAQRKAAFLSNAGWNEDERSKMMIELNTERKRVARLEKKLKRVQEFVTSETEVGWLNAEKLNIILKSGYKFKAVAMVVAAAEKTKQAAKNGKKTTSKACSLS